MEIRQENLAEQVLVTGSVPSQQVESDIEAHYTKNIAGDLEVFGFRKGKVPRRLAEKKLGAGEMYRAVLDGYFEKLVLSVASLTPIAHGDFGFAGKLDGSEGVVVTCTITLPPKVKLDAEEVLREVVYSQSTVSADEIEVEVMRRCRPHMLEDVAAGAVIQGCASAQIDFEGSVNGMPFPGGSATDFDYVPGETGFVQGFEEKLLSMEVGETGRISVNFPNDYPHDNLAGQPALFAVTIKSAKKLASDTPTDEVAQLAGFNSLEGLRDKVSTHLGGMREYDADRALRQLVSETLAAAATCETLSNDAIDAVAESAWQQFLDKHGLSEGEYAKARPQVIAIAGDAVSAKFGLDGDTGKLFDALCLEEAIRATKAEWKMVRWDSLKRDVRIKAVLDCLAEEQEIAVTEAEVASRLMELSPDSPNILDRLDSDAEFRRQAKRMIAHEKALDWAVGCVKARVGVG